MQQHPWCVKNEATCDTLHSKGVPNMIFKSELMSSNPLLYTSFFLLELFPASNLIAPSYYGCWILPYSYIEWLIAPSYQYCWDSPLLRIFGYSKFISSLSFLPISEVVTSDSHYCWDSSLTFKLVYHTTYHSMVLLLWTFGACCLPSWIDKDWYADCYLHYLMVLKYALSSLVSVQAPELV